MFVKTSSNASEDLSKLIRIENHLDCCGAAMLDRGVIIRMLRQKSANECVSFRLGILQLTSKARRIRNDTLSEKLMFKVEIEDTSWVSHVVHGCFG